MAIAERYEYATLFIFPQARILGDHLWVVLTGDDATRSFGLMPRRGELGLYNALGSEGWLVGDPTRLTFPDGDYLGDLAHEVAVEAGQPDVVTVQIREATRYRLRRRLID